MKNIFFFLFLNKVSLLLFGKNVNFVFFCILYERTLSVKGPQFLALGLNPYSDSMWAWNILIISEQLLLECPSANLKQPVGGG